MGFHAGFTSVENEQISPTGGQWPQLVRWWKWLRGGAGAGQVRSVWMPVFLSAASCTHLSHSRDLWISEFESAEVLSVSHSKGYYYLCHGAHNRCGLHLTVSCCCLFVLKWLERYVFHWQLRIYLCRNIDIFAYHFMRMFRLKLFHIGGPWSVSSASLMLLSHEFVPPEPICAKICAHKLIHAA